MNRQRPGKAMPRGKFETPVKKEHLLYDYSEEPLWEVF